MFANFGKYRFLSIFYQVSCVHCACGTLCCAPRFSQLHPRVTINQAVKVVLRRPCCSEFTCICNQYRLVHMWFEFKQVNVDAVRPKIVTTRNSVSESLNISLTKKSKEDTSTILQKMRHTLMHCSILQVNEQ